MKELTGHRITSDLLHFPDEDIDFKEAYEWSLWDGYGQKTCKDFLSHAGSEANERVKIIAGGKGQYVIVHEDAEGELQTTTIDFRKLTPESLLTVLIDHLQHLEDTEGLMGDEVYHLRYAMMEMYGEQFERVTRLMDRLRGIAR